MTPPKPQCGPGTEVLQTPIPMLDLTQPTIPFQRLALPAIDLTFLPRPVLLDSKKRGRAAADIDGDHSCLQKKKRRLRLFLITSRLSPQFSHPATNIVDRGSSKIAVWAKQKALGPSLLRKAAILNCIRRRAVSARDAVSRGRLLVEQEKEQRQLEMARLTFNYGSIDTYTRPVNSQTESIPPSVAIRNASHRSLSSSPTSSLSASPSTSRSPSPTSHTLDGTPSDAACDHRSPNAAWALSPPRSQPATRTYEPHLPSPLGLSNYDAFDAEDLGAKTENRMDLYSLLDDDDDEEEEEGEGEEAREGKARFSYLWDRHSDADSDADADADSDLDPDADAARHDSPFSPAMLTPDSISSSATTTHQSQTPATPQTEPGPELSSPWHHLFPNPYTYPYPYRYPYPYSYPDPCPLGAATKDSLNPSLNTPHTRLRPFAGARGPLAVQYPGAPVPCVVDSAPASPGRALLSPVLVPACMSPNFLCADEGV